MAMVEATTVVVEVVTPTAVATRITTPTVIVVEEEVEQTVALRRSAKETRSFRTSAIKAIKIMAAVAMARAMTATGEVAAEAQAGIIMALAEEEVTQEETLGAATMAQVEAAGTTVGLAVRVAGAGAEAQLAKPWWTIK